MLKYIKTIILLGVILALSLPVGAQNGRWDGGANQPTDPLPCGPLEEITVRPESFNGGQAVDPPQLSGQTITLVNIPPQSRNSYYEAVAQGMQLAARELGNVSISHDAPAEINSTDQSLYVENYISRAVHGILIAVSNAEDLAPSLEFALDSGIHVISYGEDTEPQAREWYVRPAANNLLAKMMVDQMAAEAGPAARFGIVTDSFDSWTQGRLLSEMDAYAARCFPEMEWLETVEAQNDSVLAFNQAATLVRAYGQDLDGLFGLTVNTTPSVAEAVSRSGLCGQVAVVGLGMPDDMRAYIESGCVQTALLWNPLELGYATVYAMRALVDGALLPGATSFDAGQLGELPILNGSDILLGVPLLINARTIGSLDF